MMGWLDGEGEGNVLVVIWEMVGKEDGLLFVYMSLTRILHI